jgi:hypothetical protein
MSGVRPDSYESKWQRRSPIMPCGLADLQPADGLAGAGCRLAARHARRKMRPIGGRRHLTFCRESKEAGCERLDASALSADGGLKVACTLRPRVARFVANPAAASLDRRAQRRSLYSREDFFVSRMSYACTPESRNSISKI